MNYEERKAALLAGINKYEENCKDLAKWMGENPETGKNEKNTTDKIRAMLEAEGYKVEMGFGGPQYAFRAVYGPDCHRHKMAVLTEYDALAGIGHACGHNLHGSMSILAGLALKDLQDELDTDFHIVGTPQEELYGGKEDMRQAGVWNQYDFAMMVHVDSNSMVSPICLATDKDTFTFTGKAAHAGAAPWDGRNALNGARLMIDAIDMLRQHIKPGDMIHCNITEGGTSVNIVPELAAVQIQYRAFKAAELRDLQRRVRNCAKGAAIATETEVSVCKSGAFMCEIMPNIGLTETLKEVFAECGITPDQDRIFASTDAGNVSCCCPALQPTLKIAPKGTALHTREMLEIALSEEGRGYISKGAEIIGLQALKVFGSPALLDQIKTDFEKLDTSGIFI